MARAARERPSFGLYLAALALFPFQWLSPFSYEQAGWTDVFIAAATLAWLIEKLRHFTKPRIRSPHYAYAAYLATVLLSALFTTAGHELAARNVAITVELIALAVMSADFARDRLGRGAIARVILLVTFVVAVQAAVGLVLFYIDRPTSLVSEESGYFKPSELYTRIAAGFFSPPLLGSFCIFASAILALPGTGLSPWLRRAAQITLGLLVVATLSRAAIGFAVAAAIRWAHARGTLQARRLAGAFAVVALAAMVAFTVAPLSLDPLRPASSHEDVNPRVRTIETSAETLVDRPVFGEGPGSLTATWQGEPFRAHLTPLNVAATTGVLSLASLAALLVILWRQRRRPTNVAIWSGLAGLGVDGLGQDIEHFRHVWILLGIADADRREGEGAESSSQRASRREGS